MDGMDNDILNDDLFKEIALKVNGVTPEQLSDYLGFEGSQASNAKKLCPAKLKSPYEILLGIFVSIPGHGKGTESAKKLRLIFLLNDMVPCVELVENALRSYGKKFPSRADTLSGRLPNPPSPPHHTPELEKAVIVIPSRADTPTRQDVSPPSPPHDKPGSETPVAPTPRGLKPLGRPEELQQQPPSISRDMIADTVNSQALDLPSSSHVKPGSETPVAATPSNLQPQPRDPPGARQQQQPYFGSGWILAVVFVAIFAVIVYFVNVKVP